MNVTYEKFKRLYLDVQQENARRNDLKTSQEYIDIVNQIDDLQESLKDRLLEIPDSSSMLLFVKEEIIEDMKEKKVLTLNGLTAKTKKKNKVNGIHVYQAFGGDTDMFMSVASITQASLKKFWVDNPEFKEPLKDCIELVSEEIVDISIAE